MSPASTALSYQARITAEYHSLPDRFMTHQAVASSKLKKPYVIKNTTNICFMSSFSLEAYQEYHPLSSADMSFFLFEKEVKRNMNAGLFIDTIEDVCNFQNFQGHPVAI